MSSIAMRCFAGAQQTEGLVYLPEWQFDPDLVRDRHVVIVDDILDTGETARAVWNEVEKLKPAEITTVFLVRKVDTEQVIEPDYWIFDIDPRVWAVGRGMDHCFQLRQLRGLFDQREENYDRFGRRQTR